MFQSSKSGSFEKMGSRKVAIQGAKVERDKEYKVGRKAERKGKDFGKWDNNF